MLGHLLKTPSDYTTCGLLHKATPHDYANVCVRLCMHIPRNTLLKFVIWLVVGVMHLLCSKLWQCFPTSLK